MPCKKQFNGWVILRFLVCNNNSNKYAPIWEINTETSEVYKLIKKIQQSLKISILKLPIKDRKSYKAEVESFIDNF